jgi:hypothetical protein
MPAKPRSRDFCRIAVPVDQQGRGRNAMTDVDEEIRHPQPVKHSDNEKSRMPQRVEAGDKPVKTRGEGEPPVE